MPCCHGNKLYTIKDKRPYLIFPSTLILAMACDFQQCGILTSVDSDEPVEPTFKLRNSE